jgi:hypothetical protein
VTADFGTWAHKEQQARCPKPSTSQGYLDRSLCGAVHASNVPHGAGTVDSHFCGGQHAPPSPSLLPVPITQQQAGVLQRKFSTPFNAAVRQYLTVIKYKRLDSVRVGIIRNCHSELLQQAQKIALPPGAFKVSQPCKAPWGRALP